MVMRDVKSGEAHACREKAVHRVSKFVSSIDHLDEREKFEKLRERFRLTWQCTNACSENFDPDKFTERNNAAKSETELSILREGSVQGVEELRMIFEVMSRSPLARVNGTSVELASCAETLRQESILLEQRRTVYEHALEDRPRTSGIVARLSCLACHLCSFLLVFEDLAAA